MQSRDTAGFQVKNWSVEMPLSLAIEPQESPLWTTSHLLQLAGWPVWVGAGGVGTLDEDDVVFVVDVVMGGELEETPTQ